MMKRFFVITVFMVLLCSKSRAQYHVEHIPDPKLNGQEYFVSNPDYILGGTTVDSLNAIASDIEHHTSAEFAMVVIRDFSGGDDFGFAFELFEAWGIGKKDNDNGLLLFIATDRRSYRFITGSGMEGVLPDALLRRIGERYLVPYFKAGDYDGGMLEAAGVIREVLLDPAKAGELRAEIRKESFFHKNKMIFMDSALILVVFIGLVWWSSFVLRRKVLKGKSLKGKSGNVGLTSILGGCGCVIGLFFGSIFISLFTGMNLDILLRVDLLPWYLALTGSSILTFRYFTGSQQVIKSFRDEKNRLQALKEYHRRMVVPLLFAPVALVSILKYRNRKKSMQERFLPPDNSGNWERLDRDKLKKKTALLDAGQLKEEWALSKSYEIWKHQISGEVRVIGWKGIRGKDFSECPECHYHTFKQPEVKTIKPATYKASGKGERIRKCVYCNHTLSLGTVEIPKKQRSSSSSSGGGSFSGGSSSSGSFGGGSSSGGGAGGRW